MKSLLPSLFLVLLCAPARDIRAATLYGQVQAPDLTATNTLVTFTPLSTPLATANSILHSGPISNETDALGFFTQDLGPGAYRATLGTNLKDSFLLSVPDDAGAYDWLSLVTGSLTYRFPYSPAYVERALLTAPGDLLTRNATNVVRLPAGTQGSVLMADPATATGLAWSNLAGLWAGQQSQLTALSNKAQTVHLQHGMFKFGGAATEGAYKLYLMFPLIYENFNTVIYFAYPEHLKVGTNFQIIALLSTTNALPGYFPWTLSLCEVVTNSGAANWADGSLRRILQSSATYNTGTNDYWKTNVFTLTNLASQACFRIEGNGSNTVPVFIRDLRIINY